jgi:hypothetical protein
LARRAFRLEYHQGGASAAGRPGHLSAASGSDRLAVKRLEARLGKSSSTAFHPARDPGMRRMSP